jgi:DNA polymerase III subunit delta'
MIDLEPLNQPKLFGLDKYFIDLTRLYKLNTYPNKLLMSGLKGIGKSTLAYHFINYVLSENENQKYDFKNLKINIDSSTYKTILNKSNPNLINIDIVADKKSIDINQIRELIDTLNKSSFNNKPRFVLIDNIELLNTNSISALLKVLEEPNKNVYFILINNNKKILSTLLSRCINYKINITHKECRDISNQLLGQELNGLINDDLINYFFTPGEIFNLIKFSNINKYNLSNLDLKSFLTLIIKDNHYKKDPFMKTMIFSLTEFYFRKLNLPFSEKINEKYSYFIRKISDTKTFNLDKESLFMEFKDEILNG